MSIKISVVIPTFNKSSLLEKTLNALSSQSLPIDKWEIVVANDCSTDSTQEVIDDFSAKWEGSLTSVSPDSNSGRASARNLGAKFSKGEWLLFIDDDIFAPENFLTAHLEMLESNLGCGVIGLVKTDSDLVDAPHFHYIDSRGAAKVLTDTVPPKYLVTQNCSVPRNVFEKIGGFDQDFSAYGFEDMDFGFCLANEGVVFKLLSNPVPTHMHHHTLDEYLAKKYECGTASISSISKKHPQMVSDMMLNWITDNSPPLKIKFFQKASKSPLYSFIKNLVSDWPVDNLYYPAFSTIYFKLIDFLVMASYYKGYSK